MHAPKHVRHGTKIHVGDATVEPGQLSAVAAEPERLPARASFFMIGILNLLLWSGLWVLVSI